MLGDERLIEVVRSLPPPQVADRSESCNVWAVAYADNGRRVAALISSQGILAVRDDGMPFEWISLDGLSYPQAPGEGSTTG